MQVTTQQTVGKRLKLARIERDLKQVQLAEMLGTSQAYVTRVEAGKINIGVDVLARLSGLLGKPIEYFFIPFDAAQSLPKAESPAARAKKKKAA